MTGRPRRVARRHGHTFTGAAAALPRFHSLRQWERSCARDEAERERRALAELAGIPDEYRKTSVQETWMCRSTGCAAGADPWTRPSRSRDGASCHRCGAPRPAGA